MAPWWKAIKPKRLTAEDFKEMVEYVKRSMKKEPWPNPETPGLDWETARWRADF